MDYHVPVLLQESIEALSIVPNGVYVDLTFGGGGHSKAILDKLGDKGRLFGFDQDPDAVQNKLNDERFVFVQANFRYIEHFAEYYDWNGVDGILADLGVSSYHFDIPERGFSYKNESMPLDMRMNVGATKTAADILNSYSPVQLQSIFSAYGEVRNAKTLARLIDEARRISPFKIVADLSFVIGKCWMGDRVKYEAQVYQALRIEVNNELEVLKAVLQSCEKLVKVGGRIVFISYHSLEDSLVKKFFRDQCFEGNPPQDMYGRRLTSLKVVSSKPIIPNKDEMKTNTRSTSAKMRIAEKV